MEEIVNGKNIIGAVLMELSKAFDSIAHALLVANFMLMVFLWMQ